MLFYIINVIEFFIFSLCTIFIKGTQFLFISLTNSGKLLLNIIFLNDEFINNLLTMIARILNHITSGSR